MKVLLQKRIGLAFILACSLAIILISNCSGSGDKKSKVGGGSLNKEEATSNDKDSKGSGSTLSCDLIEKCSGNTCECSGNDCCKDDEDCQDVCKNNISKDGLNLSGNARRTCFHLKEEVVKKLFELIEDLEKPKVERLREIGQDTDDMNLLCSAVKELDHDLLSDRIDGYSSTQAKRVLGWMAESPESLEIFENAEDDKGVPMFQKLLQKASGISSDEGVRDGLKEYVVVEDDDAKHIMHWALQSNNTELVRWIHNEIIIDKDEGLCGDDNKSNRPMHDAFDLEKNIKIRKNYGEQACILGIYCGIAPSNSDEDNDFRQEMAELIDNEVEASDFIKEEAAQGGLGLEDDIAEEWGREACCNLNPNFGYSWSNGGFPILTYDTTGCDGS